MAYANGRIPLNLLFHLGANFYLPIGTAARWLWFVAEGKRRFGVVFRITGDGDGLGGWNAYRPYDAQVAYKRKYGQWAASAGTSSHGGTWGGREVFAIDVDNWAAVPWAQFVALASEAGFRTNFVTPTERWHIGDFNNAWDVPAFAASYVSNPASDNYGEDMIRIQAPNKGIAMIGSGYYRPLANDREVAASSLIMSRHIDCTDSDYDLFVTIAIGGTPAGNLAAVVRNAATPLRIYRNKGKLLAISDGGQVWILPNDGYRDLLVALGLAGPDVIRDIPDNELDFMKEILSGLYPASSATVQMKPEDIEKIAASVKPGATPDEVANAVREKFAATPLK